MTIPNEINQLFVKSIFYHTEIIHLSYAMYLILCTPDKSNKIKLKGAVYLKICSAQPVVEKRPNKH